MGNNCYIEDGYIVIKIAIDALPFAFRCGVELGTIPPGVEISDAAKFAPEVTRALENEDEEGTTAIHKLFDKAMWDAVENGAEGVEEIE